MKLYLREIPTNQRPIIAGYHTPWARTEVPTLKDRTYEHGAKVISGGAITLGHGYSTLAWIPEDEGSWAWEQSEKVGLVSRRSLYAC